MKSTRRNHYRMLHVQPEAPPEVIASSYRTLMQKLKAHPDLGGDPDYAVLLNEAYAVLSDPARRQRYDAELARLGRLQKALRDAGLAGGSTPGSATGNAHRASRSAAPASLCAWCTEPRPPHIRPDSRCRRCESPLAQASGARSKHDLFGRRHSQRVARSGVVAVFSAWGQPARGGRLRDLSLTGFSLLVDVQFAPGQALRINDAGMDLLAEVVASRREGRYWIVHARSTHMLFVRRAGAFVATTA